MCSIMALSKKHVSMEKFQANFAKTNSRGPDMMRMEAIGDCVLGFQRLAIMGLDKSGMQPFLLHGNAVVCNGELYGFREEKKILEEQGYEEIQVKKDLAGLDRVVMGRYNKE